MDPDPSEEEHFNYKALRTKDVIKAVKERQCLWDKSSAGYKNKYCRDEAWNEICTLLYPKYVKLDKTQKRLVVQGISKKWYNTRDAYVKSKKSKTRRHYIYSKLLSFLDGHCMLYLKEPNVPDESQEEWLEDAIETKYLESDVDVPLKEEYIDIEDLNRDNQSEGIVGVLTKILQMENDVDMAFFKSILPTVKALSEDSRLEFRIEMMKLLKSFVEKDRPVPNCLLKINSDEE